MTSDAALGRAMLWKLEPEEDAFAARGHAQEQERSPTSRTSALPSPAGTTHGPDPDTNLLRWERRESSLQKWAFFLIYFF